MFSYGIVLAEIQLRKKPRERTPQECFEFPAAEFLAALPASAPKGLSELTLRCCTHEAAKR